MCSPPKNRELSGCEPRATNAHHDVSIILQHMNTIGLSWGGSRQGLLTTRCILGGIGIEYANVDRRRRSVIRNMDGWIVRPFENGSSFSCVSGVVRV